MEALAYRILFTTWALPIALVVLLRRPPRHGVIAVATYGLTMAIVSIPAGIYFVFHNIGANIYAPTLFSGIAYLVSALGLLLAPTSSFRLLFYIAPLGLLWYFSGAFWVMGIRAVLSMDLFNKLMLGPIIVAPLSGIIFLSLKSTRKYLREYK
jgi:hypothetical protein